MNKVSVHLKRSFLRGSIAGALALGFMTQATALTITPLSNMFMHSLAFAGSDISGTKFGQGLKAVNELGEESSFADYKGKVTLVFFGYTQCPDICPTALAELTDVVEQLSPEEAKQVQVVMVSIDPERDTPEVMKAYLSVFHEDFKGMTGSAKQIAEMAKSFRAYYKRVGSAENYAMEHSSSIYALDKKGESRILFRPNTPQEDMLKDIRELLATS